MRKRLAEQAHNTGLQCHLAAAAGATAGCGHGDLCFGEHLREVAAVVVEQSPAQLLRTRRNQRAHENAFRDAVNASD